MGWEFNEIKHIYRVQHSPPNLLPLEFVPSLFLNHHIPCKMGQTFAIVLAVLISPFSFCFCFFCHLHKLATLQSNAVLSGEAHLPQCKWPKEEVTYNQLHLKKRSSVLFLIFSPAWYTYRLRQQWWSFSIQYLSDSFKMTHLIMPLYYLNLPLTWLIM